MVLLQRHHTLASLTRSVEWLIHSEMISIATKTKWYENINNKATESFACWALGLQG